MMDSQDRSFKAGVEPISAPGRDRSETDTSCQPGRQRRVIEPGRKHVLPKSRTALASAARHSTRVQSRAAYSAEMNTTTAPACSP